MHSNMSAMPRNIDGNNFRKDLSVLLLNSVNASELKLDYLTL
jgi:hypothetical protein